MRTDMSEQEVWKWFKEKWKKTTTDSNNREIYRFKKEGRLGPKRWQLHDIFNPQIWKWEAVTSWDRRNQRKECVTYRNSRFEHCGADAYQNAKRNRWGAQEIPSIIGSNDEDDPFDQHMKGSQIQQNYDEKSTDHVRQVIILYKNQKNQNADPRETGNAEDRETNISINLFRKTHHASAIFWNQQDTEARRKDQMRNMRDLISNEKGYEIKLKVIQDGGGRRRQLTKGQ